MILFGTYCNKYAGKVYPEKKMVLPREYAKGEEDVSFYCKVLIVEELGDFYNLEMMSNQNICPLVSKINRVHHIDEARHLAFGRQYLSELFAAYKEKWTAEEMDRFQTWLKNYLASSWGDFYNPAVYKDAGIDDGYGVRQMALKHPVCRAFRENASDKLITYFLTNGMLSEAPEL
jgi:hypothetical protein